MACLNLPPNFCPIVPAAAVSPPPRPANVVRTSSLVPAAGRSSTQRLPFAVTERIRSVPTPAVIPPPLRPIKAVASSSLSSAAGRSTAQGYPLLPFGLTEKYTRDRAAASDAASAGFAAPAVDPVPPTPSAVPHKRFQKRRRPHHAFMPTNEYKPTIFRPVDPWRQQDVVARSAKENVKATPSPAPPPVQSTSRQTSAPSSGRIRTWRNRQQLFDPASRQARAPDREIAPRGSAKKFPPGIIIDHLLASRFELSSLHVGSTNKCLAKALRANQFGNEGDYDRIQRD
ncbi:hypothetical protein BGX23_009390, partial [Mortierella sp. AD031]